MIQLLYINRHLKTAILLTLDILLCFISMIFAFYIRLGYFPDLQTNHVLVTLISIFWIIPFFWFFNLYKELLRFMNWTIIKILSKTFLFYLFTFFLIISTFQFSHIPRTIGILQPLLLIMLVIPTSSSSVFVSVSVSDSDCSELDTSPSPVVADAAILV